MNEFQLIGLLRDSNVQLSQLFGQVITINFAMIVAIYYFLHRATMPLKVAAMAFYLTGMLSLIGRMLVESNLKYHAMLALAALPTNQLSQLGESYLEYRNSWLASATALFTNAAIWLLIAVVAYLLFWWRRDAESGQQHEASAASEEGRPDGDCNA